MKKRILCIWLVIVMCLSLLPVNASANSETDAANVAEDGTNQEENSAQDENSAQGENSTQDAPYVNQYGWKLADELGYADLYVWIYDCIKAAFTETEYEIEIENKDIDLTGIEGVVVSDKGYIFQTEQSVVGDLWILSQTLKPNDDPDFDYFFENLTNDVSCLHIPVVQYSNVPTENIMNIMECVIQDNPEFCFPSSYSIIKANDGTPLYISGYYHKDKIAADMESCISHAREEVASRVNKSIESMREEPVNDLLPLRNVAEKVEVAKIIHDYIVETANPGSIPCPNGKSCEGCSSCPGGESKPFLWQSTMYSVFDAKQQGLCEGYAQAFNYLARLYGIESITMTGEAFYNSPLSTDPQNPELIAGGHAWNAVYFGDVNDAIEYKKASNWSPIDVFWDEPLHENSIMKTNYKENETKVLQKYFLNSETIFTSPDEEYYRIITNTSGYGNYPFKGIPSASYDIDGNKLTNADDSTTGTYDPELVITYSFNDEDNRGNIYIDRATGTVIDADATLTAVDIPELVDDVKVTAIAKKAFHYCMSLETIKIPASVSRIDEYAFGRCESLTKFIVAEGNQTYRTDEKGVLYCDSNEVVNGKNEAITTLVAFPGGLSGEYIIPDGVTKIGNFAFCENTGLTGVEIPDTVTSIGNYAFIACSELSTVNIPAKEGTIGDLAFAGCYKMTLAEDSLANVTGIGQLAFADCVELTSVTISDEVTLISPGQFYECNRLDTVVIGEKVESIGADAFLGCSALRNVKLSENLKTIGRDSFSGCASLKEITLFEGVATICEGAFSGCPIQSIVLPKSLKVIGAAAFSNTTLLKDVYYGGTADDWAKITIGVTNGCLTQATIHFTEPEPEIPVLPELMFNMNISVGAEMVVNYNFMASVVNSYSDFYLEVKKYVADGDPVITVYGMTSDRVAMGYMPNPATGEPLMYNAAYTGINAKEMGNIFETTLYVVDAEGKIYRSETVERSIEEYLIGKMNAPGAIDELKTMAVDMLKYGAAAQIKFNYNTENLVTDSLTEEQLAWGTQTEAVAVDYSAVSGSGANVKTNITVKSKVELVLTCIASGIANPAGVKCVITDEDGNVLDELATINTLDVMYGATYDNVGAKEMRKLITATFYDETGVAISKTVTWSVESYVAQVRASDDPDEIDIAVVNAMLVYGDAVAAYMEAIAK